MVGSIVVRLQIILALGLAFTVQPVRAADPTDELVMELARTYFLLSSPIVDKATKSRQIDELLGKLEAKLGESASTVQALQTRLGSWTTQLQREIDGGRASRVHQDIDDLMTKAGMGLGGQLPDAKTVKSLVDSFQVFLAPLIQHEPQEKYRYRVKMGMEWMRHIVRMEEENLYGIVSQHPETRTKSAKQLAEDLQNISRRSRALMRLTQIFSNSLDVQRVPDPLDSTKTTMQIKLKAVDMTPHLEEIFEHLDTLGTFYGKMGQTLSNMDMFFGPDITKWFRSLQSQYKQAMPFEDVKKMFREDFGRDIHEIYSEFEEAPFARGTMAQTHNARRRDTGEKVAVKIQRPGLLEELRWNSGINTAMVKFMKVMAADRASSEVLDMLNEQLDGMVSSFASETFFDLEANTMEAFRPRLGFLGGAKVPKAHMDLVSPRIITMEHVSGQSIDDYLDDPKNTHGAKRVFRQLLDVLADFAIIGHGHIDLQPGNLLATHEGRLVLLDWGNTARIRGLVMHPLKLLRALRDRDPKKIAEALAQMQKEGGTVKAEQLLPLIQAHLGLMSNGKSKKWEGILGANKRKSGERPSGPPDLGAPTTDPAGERKAQDLPPFLKLVFESSMKLGFRLDPEYSRILRGTIPLLGTLDRFETRLGTDEMNRIMERFPMELAFKAPLKLANLALRAVTHPIPAARKVPCKFGLLDTDGLLPNKVIGDQAANP